MFRACGRRRRGDTATKQKKKQKRQRWEEIRRETRRGKKRGRRKQTRVERRKWDANGARLTSHLATVRHHRRQLRQIGVARFRVDDSVCIPFFYSRRSALHPYRWSARRRVIIILTRLCVSRDRGYGRDEFGFPSFQTLFEFRPREGDAFQYRRRREVDLVDLFGALSLLVVVAIRAKPSSSPVASTRLRGSRFRKHQYRSRSYDRDIPFAGRAGL